MSSCVNLINKVEHFNKYRSLSFSELYHFLYTYFRDYIEYSSFVVYIKRTRSIHVPRCIFSRNIGGLCILPILIVDDHTSHYNILIIDKNNNMVERFEPSDSSYDKDLNALLKMAFNDNKYKYVYTKHIGPQFMEINEVGVTMNCGFWVLLYTQDRLKDFSVKQKHFLQKWMNNISKCGFHYWISEYKKCVLQICSERKLDNNYICDRIYNRRPLDYYDYMLKTNTIN